MPIDTAAVQQWWNAPEILQHQIAALAEYYAKRDPIKTRLEKWCKDFHAINFNNQVFEGETAKNIALFSCILKYISAMRVTHVKFFPQLHCYNELGEPIIELKDYITKGENMKLFKAEFISSKKTYGYGNIPLVVKLYESRGGRNTLHEIDVYRKLGNPSPSLNINCYLWNQPVLVMRPMEELGYDDDIYEIGIQILQQFPALHKFTVHSDLKPDNIMKEIPASSNDGDDSGGGNNDNVQGCNRKRNKPIYKLIDFGGCAKEKSKYGYCRRTWSRKWQCQERESGVVTTPKWDMIELGHALCGLKYKNEHKCKNYPEHNKRIFTGKLKKYMDYVESLDDKRIRCSEYEPHYRKCIEILKGEDSSSSSDSSSSPSSDDKNKNNKNSKISNRKSDRKNKNGKGKKNNKSKIRK